MLMFSYLQFKNKPWLMWLSGLNASLQRMRIKGSPVQFPVRAHAWVVGWATSRGHEGGNHTSGFFSLSPSLPLSLKINKTPQNKIKSYARVGWQHRETWLTSSHNHIKITTET